MTKQDIITEIEKLGTIKETQVKDEQDTKWYKVIYWADKAGIGNFNIKSFYVRNEKEETEEAFWLPGQKPVEPVIQTEEEVFEQQVKVKLLELKVEAEAKKRLTI